MMAFRVAPVLALALAAATAQAQTAPATQAAATATTASNTAPDDEMVVSGPAAAPPPAAVDAAKTAATSTSNAKPLTTDEQIKAWITDAPKLDHAASGSGDTADATDGAAAAPRQIHGEAGVAVGSNGYSSAYASSLIPVGKDSTLGIAVSQADYGGGTVDHGRIALPRGRSQSVAISLQMGNGQAQVPADCPGFMEDGRYIAPVWWSRLHPDQTCTVETDKHAETDPSGQ